jgi:hypothetical protein
LLPKSLNFTFNDIYKHNFTFITVSNHSLVPHVQHVVGIWAPKNTCRMTEPTSPKPSCPGFEGHSHPIFPGSKRHWCLLLCTSLGHWKGKDCGVELWSVRWREKCENALTHENTIILPSHVIHQFHHERAHWKSQTIIQVNLTLNDDPKLFLS